MKIQVSGFSGEQPRVAPDLLGERAAQQAVNARLLSGRLEPWKNFGDHGQLCKNAPINTIYPLRNPSNQSQVEWLHWRNNELGAGAQNVDVAKSIIAGDTTGRVYITGLDMPRWTDWSLATTGSGCAPKATRPLGVIAPDVAPNVSGQVAQSSPIDISDGFENDSGWTLVPPLSGPSGGRRVELLPTGGNPNGRMRFILGDGYSMAYAYRDFGVGNSSQVTVEFDYRLDVRFSDAYPTEDLWLPKQYQFFTVLLMCDAEGNGARINWEANEPPPSSSITGRSGQSWSQNGSVVSSQQTTALPPLGQWSRVKLVGNRQPGGTYTWRVTVMVGSTAIIDDILQGLPARGGYVGLAIPGSIAGHGVQHSSVDNLRVTASAPPLDTSDDVTTSYVYTFVAQVGAGYEESAPSPPSATIIRDDGTEITVTTATAPPTGPDYNIVAKRIYRAVTGASGTDYYFLAEIPLSQATYVDNTPDRVAVLGSILKSADWDLPPQDLRGILALPNGIMAGFKKNELCLSEQGYPHAWPIKYRLATDHDIVGIGAIDTMVVICTQGFPYIAAGNSPGSYSMMKIELPQACVSKRSIAYVLGVGVVYASPDGLVSVSGPGRAAVITKHLFSRREWQALRPESIIATAHDNRYVMFYDNGSQKGGLVLDFDEAGFGVVRLQFHASAVVSDLIDDKLYMVLDYNEPPSLTPVQIVHDGRTLYSFDDYNGGPLPPMLSYMWKSREWVLPYPVTFRYARVVADKFDDLKIRLLDLDVPYATIQVWSDREFVLPGNYSSDGVTRFAFEVYGTSAITSVQFAEDVSELE